MPGIGARALEFAILTAARSGEARGATWAEIDLDATVWTVSADCIHFPLEVAEMALAHAIGDKVEAAYRRGDLFDKRRRLMDDWGAFLDSAKEQDGS